jgi:hypothetical protein
MTQTSTRLDRPELLALRGLRLPRVALRRLQQSGIYCNPSVSMEHQNLAKRHVLRGTESGGAVAELGVYCGFVGEDGKPQAWLQRVDGVGVNGVHAIVVATNFVRVHMFRAGESYDLLITRHVLAPISGGPRPLLQNSILFHGRQGSLTLELWGKDVELRGKIAPVFYSRSGEPMTPPDMFQDALLRITASVSCLGCRHCHLLQPGVLEVDATASKISAEEGRDAG